MATREERPRSALARGRLWLWVRRVLVALVGLIVLLLLVGLLYQFLATRIAYRNYPAPGEMVLVSGHDMQFYCTGKARRGPTVVMDAGLGGGLLRHRLERLGANAAHEPADRQGASRPAL
jgi:hypothetical protein